MWRDAALVAGRDLRVELRSRVTTNQVAPFSVLVLILFPFALDPDRQLLERLASGLYWTAVLFAALLAISRSAAIDETDGVRDALRLSGIDPAGGLGGKAGGGGGALRLSGIAPAGVFVGKAAAVAVVLFGLEVLLGVGVVVLYGVDLAGAGLVVLAALAATVAVAATGTLYGALVSGLRVRETLLPLLLLP